MADTPPVAPPPETAAPGAPYQVVGPPEPVIVPGAHNRLHRFPPGFDRQKAMDIVIQRDKDEAGAADDSSTSTVGTTGVNLAKYGNAIKESFKGIIPGLYSIARDPGKFTQSIADNAKDETLKAIDSYHKMMNAFEQRGGTAGVSGASLSNIPSTIAPALKEGGNMVRHMGAVTPIYGPMGEHLYERAQNDPYGAAGEFTGNMLTALATEGANRFVGRTMQWAAPKVVDTGLWRSAAEKADFEGTPQRLVDESQITGVHVDDSVPGAKYLDKLPGQPFRQKPGMMPPTFKIQWPEGSWRPTVDTLPWKQRVGEWMDQTEATAQDLARSYAQRVRDRIRGLLPEATHPIPLQTEGGVWPPPRYPPSIEHPPPEGPYGGAGSTAAVVGEPGTMRVPMSTLDPETQVRLGNVPGELRYDPPGQAAPYQLALRARDSAIKAGHMQGLGNITENIPEWQALTEKAREYLSGATAPLDAEDLLLGKRAHQAEVNYTTNPRAKPSAASSDNFTRGLAAAEREKLIQLVDDKALPEAPPTPGGIEEQLGREEDLLGAKYSLGRKRSMPLTKVGAARYVAAAPELVGRLGIGLDRVGKHMFSSPNAYRAAILSLLAAEGQPRNPDEDTATGRPDETPAPTLLKK